MNCTVEDIAASGIAIEIFSIPLEDADRFLVYVPLHRTAFVTNARGVNAIVRWKHGSAGFDDESELGGFLRHLGLLNDGTAENPVTTFKGSPEPISVTLFLTTACNLRCTYCYASAGDKPARSMGLAVAKRGIDFVAKNAVKKGASNFEVNYHGGGEPSANWLTMTQSLNYARQVALRSGLGPPLASAASNGVLRDDQIDWIIANMNGGVSVSFDGLPSAHDKHRLTVLGQGSSSRVIHTLKRFDQAAFPYGIRVTVTADQIPQLPDSVDFICQNFGTTRIQVEPAYQLGRWTAAPSAETEEFIRQYRLGQERAARHGREIFFSAARTGTLSNHFCGVTQDTLALSPDGNVSACYEVFDEENPLANVFFYGSPNQQEGFAFDLAALEHLRKQAVQHREFCQGCFAKWTCSGDCYHKAVSVSGSLEFQGTDRCHITRELTKDQILANIAAAGGLFWQAPLGSSSNSAKGKETLL